MPDDNSTSLINLGDLSKPANTLVKKVSSAIGGVFAPWQIKRIAKAEAEANLLRAKTDIEITDLHRRAMHRFFEEEATRQENMEEITRKSLPLLKEDANPNEMEDDWVTNFFDKSRIVSDVDMQGLWAKVLAGEANSPGSYSKKTVNLLSDLDKRDAELFQSLCRFGWVIGRFSTLVFDAEAEIYNAVGINFSSLSHLDSLGLIQFNSVSGFIRKGLPKMATVYYFGEPLVLTMPEEEKNNLKCGHVLLSQFGQQLVTVIDSPRVEGFDAYVREQWKQYLPDVVNT